MKKDFLKKYLHLILIALVAPIIFISMLSAIIKWGTTLLNTNELIIDVYEPINIGDYLGYYISIISVIITGVLSYALLNTSMKSNELSEDIKSKEEKRDKEIIRESALIVYYDLISNLSILKSMYCSKNLKSIIIEEEKLNIISDWVKNVANLRDILTSKELETIFNLYNNLLLLNELDNKLSNEINLLVKSLSEKIFIPVLLDYLWMDFEGMTESILNSKYYLILRKIELASKASSSNDINIFKNENGQTTVKQSNGNIKFKGTLVDGVITNGEDKWYTDKGKLLYSFEYNNGQIVNGKYINNFRGKYELIFDGEFKNNNELVNGYTTLFYASKKVRYQGFIKNGQFDGKGIYCFSGSKLNEYFNGIWNDGKKVNGEYINLNKEDIGIIYFKGKYYENKPYSGDIECSDSYKFNDSYGFKGLISEGKPIKGIGYVFLKDIIDEEYKERILWDEYRTNKYDYEDFSPNIPYEIQQELQQEMYDEYERDIKKYDLEMLEDDYGHIVELIGAEWDNGYPILYEDDILNKRHLIYHSSKKIK